MMMRRIISFVIALCALSFVLISCEHRLLTDIKDSHYIRVYLDEDIKNVTCGFYNETYDKPEYEAPVNLRVALADPSTGKVVAERILRNNGQDEQGRYIEGLIAAPMGQYCLVVHEIGSSVTKINDLYDFYNMHAYTEHIDEDSFVFIPESGKSGSESRIVKQPDHLFYDVCENVVARYSETADTLYNSHGNHFRARSIATSYYLQIRVKGIQWVTSAAVTLSGMAGSFRMSEPGGFQESEPVDLFIRTKSAERKREGNSGNTTSILYTTFNTFGKLPGVNSIITFEFLKTDGSSQVEELDITDLFETSTVKEKQWILLDKEIEINRPKGTGGMRPGVDEWKDITTDVEM